MTQLQLLQNIKFFFSVFKKRLYLYLEWSTLLVLLINLSLSIYSLYKLGTQNRYYELVIIFSNSYHILGSTLSFILFFLTIFFFILFLYRGFSSFIIFFSYFFFFFQILFIYYLKQGDYFHDIITQNKIFQIFTIYSFQAKLDYLHIMRPIDCLLLGAFQESVCSDALNLKILNSIVDNFVYTIINKESFGYSLDNSSNSTYFILKIFYLLKFYPILPNFINLKWFVGFDSCYAWSRLVNRFVDVSPGSSFTSFRIYRWTMFLKGEKTKKSRIKKKYR